MIRARTGAVLALLAALAFSVSGAVGCTDGPETDDGVKTMPLALGASTFETTDGDLVTNGHLDWENAAGMPNFTPGYDLPSGSGDDAYGGGSKEDSIDPPLDYGSIPPNKSDLSRFYVYYENAGGIDYLHFAWVRENILGTANMSMELNQSPLLTPGGNPVRTEGDVLLIFDWASGNKVVNLGALRWREAGPCYANGSSPPCWGDFIDLDAAGYAEGSVNETASVYDPIAAEWLQEKTFGEGTVDLTNSGIIAPDECVGFAQGVMRSRSSDSFTSKTKDRIGPTPVDIDLCQPVEIRILKLDSEGAPLAGAVFELYYDGDDNDVLSSGDLRIQTHPDGYDQCTTGADGVGDCIFSVETNGTYIAHEVTAPPGYLPVDDKITDPDVEITREPQTITLEFTNAPAPGRINVFKQDDQGAPLAGVTFQLLNDLTPLGGAPGTEDTDTGRTCTTDATGVCSFDNLDLGAYWVVEVAAPAGHDLPTPPYQNATIGLGSSPGEGQTVGLTFVNPIVPGRIIIHKQDDQGAPLAGIEFILLTDAAPLGGAPGTGDAETGMGCTTDVTGTCSIEDVPLGTYWVVEVTSSVPAGYFPATPPYQQATIGYGTAQGVGDTVEVTFVNPRKFRIIVIVCQGDGPLHPSAVSIDGAASQTSISSAQADALGYTDAGLCAIPQANFGNLADGAHTGAVNIP